jgi:hypothetical protein
MYPKGPQQYVPPKYLDIPEERMRNYKKILHQSQWEVQSKLMVIKVRTRFFFSSFFSFVVCFFPLYAAAVAALNLHSFIHSRLTQANLFLWIRL